LYMKTGKNSAYLFVISFFTVVFLVAMIKNPHYPTLVFIGESSVGTWVSGVLLVISGSTTLILGVSHRKQPWWLLSAFFFMLATDERFMFHEQAKEFLVFTLGFRHKWLVELPVVIGAVFGFLAAYVLWKYLEGINRALLGCAVILGFASVIFDILSLGVLWEESFKLSGELLITCALLKKAESELKID
ncbi:MAG: hypothetical protein K2Q22_05655, partial [Cytophagales bacterium]|nr:hypothetical protein [Cytophagales bacterium]